jgi:hypothetical protein
VCVCGESLFWCVGGRRCSDGFAELWLYGGRGVVVGVLTWMVFWRQIWLIFKVTAYGARMGRNPFPGSASTTISATVQMGQMSPVCIL